MPTTPLPADAVALLRRPNPAVMATLRADGSPVSAATWYLWEDDGRVLLNLDATRVRLGHLRRDPRVTLTVLDGDDWYTHLTLLGRVVDLHADPDLADIDRLSRHYTGHAYGDRTGERWTALVEVDRWTGWGAQRG
ncbi:PPOX class F420-dependent oxidoreductase [Cellulomonas triticagri]|uniref:PPOX class F420-dependent oxidoreductase n=1 Tax=Cellulomonas triticagri TaxID=2483352 RepID=A0A3M2JR17_9CELL|nr:PPOX class F420-dependent oxidoreductase [Cellulomonas triticagri]RMI14290.1 PPOX class F420-dependent oxidoreductase [Cellulomonas triticagri]